MRRTSFIYRLGNQEMSEFALLADSFDPNAIYSLRTDVQFSYQASAAMLKCRMSFMLLNDTQQPQLTAVFDSFFLIKEESIKQNMTEGKLTFPENCLLHMASVTYSSLRGALLIKTQGTAFNRFLLPLLDVNKLIDHPFEVEL